MKHILLSGLAIALLAPAALATQQANDDRPQVGLVLSGGGARGAAHIGVLQMLEELRVPVDYIAGTSMGAVVGGLYAAGTSIEKLIEIAEQTDWDEKLDDKPARSLLSFRRKQDDRDYLIDFDVGIGAEGVRLPRGLLQGQKLNLMLKANTLAVADIEHFDALPIPFRALATDIETGAAVVLERGDLATALRASMAVPAVFAPVEFDGRLLVDGGIANNMPIDVARAMGADLLIVVNVEYPLAARDELRSALDITNQLITILVARESAAQLGTLGQDDVLIVPELGTMGSSAFDQTGTAVAIGYEGTSRQRARLDALRLPEQAYLAHRAARTRAHEPVAIDFVQAGGSNTLSDEVLGARLALHGTPTSIAMLETGIEELYGLDTFERIDYETVVDEAGTGVRVTATDKSWGPDYINFGARLVDDLEGSSAYAVSLRHTRTGFNRLGAEWRNDIVIGTNPRLATEFYQPLDPRWRFFVAPSLSLDRYEANRFDGEDRIAQLVVSAATARLDAGRNFGNWGELRIGLERTSGRVSRRTGVSDDARSFDDGAMVARFGLDTLDNVSFPRTGALATLSWHSFRESLGSRDSADRIESGSVSAITRGHSTWLLTHQAGSNLREEGEVQNLFSLGGLFNLSGLRNDQLQGQHYAIADVIYYRSLEPLFDLPFYAGASLELGNTWDDDSRISFDDVIFAGSVFVGFDTVFGPMYLAYGLAEGGQSAAYFLLGPRFER